MAKSEAAPEGAKSDKPEKKEGAAGSASRNMRSR
jgi:hypothetical protein